MTEKLLFECNKVCVLYRPYLSEAALPGPTIDTEKGLYDFVKNFLTSDAEKATGGCTITCAN
ncbi:MAG: hypothetical protein HUJ74_03590 [Lachnospiraceae bacterium]|nr:hypothetical protein [Lachnospiraceae bacterium]